LRDDLRVGRHVEHGRRAEHQRLLELARVPHVRVAVDEAWKQGGAGPIDDDGAGRSFDVLSDRHDRSASHEELPRAEHPFAVEDADVAKPKRVERGGLGGFMPDAARDEK
jgi:hypothetical protein